MSYPVVSSLYLRVSLRADAQLVVGCVSDAQQNLIMKHASTRTFLNHYLPRNIDTDMQNIMNGRPENKTLMKCIRRISRWIDKRRPRRASPEERASLYRHPEYTEAVRRRDDQATACQQDPSPRNQSRLARLKKDVAGIFHRLLRELKKEVRRTFSRKQAKIDIERQLSGSAIHDKETKQILREEAQMPSALIRLLEKLLTWPTSNSLEDEWARRNAGTKAVTEYCPVLEGGPLRGRRKRAAPSDDGPGQASSGKRAARVVPTVDRRPINPGGRPNQVVLGDEKRCVPKPAICETPTSMSDVDDDPFEKAKKHILTSPKPERCFQCYGDPSLPEHRRLQTWSRYDATVRHFRTKHLQERRCKFCDDGGDIVTQMHWQNHASTVHRLKT